jgi:hypothetical protein
MVGSEQRLAALESGSDLERSKQSTLGKAESELT